MSDFHEYQDIVHLNPDGTVAYRLRVDPKTGEIIDPPNTETLALAAHRHRHAAEQRDLHEALRDRLSWFLANNMPEKEMRFPGIKAVRIEPEERPMSTAQFADWVNMTELDGPEWAFILAHFRPPSDAKPPTERMAQAIENARMRRPKSPYVRTTRIPEDI